MVARENRAAHCFLTLRLIDEINCDVTFRDVQTSGFGRWLTFNFNTNEMDNLVELISSRLDS